MQENIICPGCGRHCDLERPHCGRGEEYSRTGKMPEHQRKQQDQEMHTANDSAAGIDDRLIISLRDLHHTMRSLYEGKASQKRILIILNESETITQRDLTERLGIQPGSASEILSKLEGGTWGLANLPPKYAPLITDALTAYTTSSTMNPNTVLAREYATDLLKRIRMGNKTEGF